MDVSSKLLPKKLRKSEYDRQYRANNRDKKKAQDKAYQQANREKILEHHKNYYREHKEKWVAASVKRRTENRAEHLRYQREYYRQHKHLRVAYRKANSERVRAWKRKWYNENRQSIRASIRANKQTQERMRSYMLRWRADHKPLVRSQKLDWVAKHPEAVKMHARKTYEKHKESRLSTCHRYYHEVARKRNADWKARHFFAARARTWNKIGANVTAKDLASLWKRQRGRCPLTGIKLDRRAQIDHIVHRSKGGTHSISNLRWTTAWANWARMDLEDGDFINMCSAVVDHDQRMG